MTTPNIKVKVVRKPSLKLKVFPKFPSSVSVSSPITLDRTGGNFSFSLSVTDLRVTFDGIYAPIGSAPGGTSGQIQINSSGVFAGISNTQLTARINSFSSLLPGAVPASGGGTTNFLRADGTFAAPSGGASSPIVILCAGQSQNVKSKTFSWSPSSSAKIWNNTVGTVSTGTAFVALDGTNANFPQVFASNIAITTGRPVYLINSSFTGQPISHWLSGTGAPDMYADAVANVAAAMTALSLTKIDIFVWWQGEGDTGPLNTSYIANHATMMTRFWGNSWFPQETPVLVNSIASTAIGGNSDADHMNTLLLGVVNADPDKRRYVYPASLSSATYWDATDVGHMTAQGYYSAAALAASAFLNGPGRNSLPKVVVDPANGFITWGTPGFSAAPFSYNLNSSAATLPTTSASRQLVGADTTNVFEIFDAFGAFTNFVGRRANGTLASKTALAANDLITGFGAQGYDGSAYSSGNVASVSVYAGEAWSGSAHGTYISFYTTKNGTTTVSEHYRFAPGVITVFGTTSGSGTLTAPAALGSPAWVWPTNSGTLAVSASAPIVLNASTGNLTLTGGNLPATATNDSASAGNLGEYVESNIAAASGVSLTSTTAANITSISLTAGDWDVDAMANFSGGATTTITYLAASLSLTTATVDATVGRYNVLFGFGGALFDSRSPSVTATLPIAPLRFSLSVTTTVFLVANSSFATSTAKAFGILRARRVR